MVNFGRLSGATNTGFVGFLSANFLTGVSKLSVLWVQGFIRRTGPGATGCAKLRPLPCSHRCKRSHSWIMILCLGLMTYFAMEKRRRYHFEQFWYTCVIAVTKIAFVRG